MTRFSFWDSPSSCFLKKHDVSEGSVVVGGTGDDMLWNDSEEVGDIRTGCKEDEGTDYEDGVFLSRHIFMGSS